MPVGTSVLISTTAPKAKVGMKESRAEMELMPYHVSSDATVREPM